MDDDTRKIMTVIAAFDAEHARLQEAVKSLNGSGQHLAIVVRQAAQGAVEDALKGLHPHTDRAGKTLVGLQRFSVWRAATRCQDKDYRVRSAEKALCVRGSGGRHVWCRGQQGRCG